MAQGFFRGSSLQRKKKDRTRGLPKCGQCGFATKCFSPRMPVEGDGSVDVMVLGEAPGQDDDRQGTAFVGEGGDRLRDSLSNIDKSLEDCHVSFAMICRPINDKWKMKNVEACRPAVLKNVDEKKPKVILLLGAAPVRSLIPSERGGAVGAQKQWVGLAIPSRQHNAWLCPTFSPKQILKGGEDPVHLLLWEQHLQQAFDLVKKPPFAPSMEELNAQVDVIMSPTQARAKLRDLLKKKGQAAFDYETNCIKPETHGGRILSAAFSFRGEDTFAFLCKDDKVVRLLSKCLKRRELKFVASNLKFEERWSINKLGHPVANWYWDTMLAAHALDNQKATSVKFLAFRYFGVPDYDKFVADYKKSEKGQLNKMEKLDPRDLLIYNGLDALLEFMVMRKQRKEMGCA